MTLGAQTYRQAIGSALTQQLLGLLLAALILDGGLIAEMCLFAAVAFWGGVAAIWMRRGAVPTRVDLLVIEVGFLPLCVISCLLSPWIWRLRGVWW